MKRFLSILLSTTLLCLSIQFPSHAATDKTGSTVTGEEVLEYINEELVEKDEPEMSILIQTRDFAKLSGNGYKAVNFGALLTNDGTKEGIAPVKISKKNPLKLCYRYITSTQPEVFVVNYTNVITNKTKQYALFQKNKYLDLDAFELKDSFYGYQLKDYEENEEGERIIFENIACLTDKENVLYIYPDRQYKAYKIVSANEDKEEIGMFFQEVNRTQSTQSRGYKLGNSSVVFIGDSRTVCMFSDSGESTINGDMQDDIKIYAGWGQGYNFMTNAVASAGEFETLAVWLGCNDAAQGKSFTDDYAPYYENLLAQGKKIVLFNVGRTEDKYLVSGDEGYKNSNMVAYNATMEAWAKGRDGVTYVDMYSKSSAWQLNTSDGIHYGPRPTTSIWNICKSFF